MIHICFALTVVVSPVVMMITVFIATIGLTRSRRKLVLVSKSFRFKLAMQQEKKKERKANTYSSFSSFSSPSVMSDPLFKMQANSFDNAVTITNPPPRTH